MRYGVPVALLAALLLVSGCSDDAPPPPPAAAESQPPEPVYDETQEPAAAVLALVPQDTATVTVTDFEQIRLELGAGELTGGSAPEEIASFWERADRERPLLTTGMLRPTERRLSGRYGISQVDVAWEAHLYDADDQETGWVLRFRDGTDMAQVAQAASDPQGVLGGATVAPAEHLVSSGTTPDPSSSWATDPETVEMAGLPANATYLSRGCNPDAADSRLDELETYAIQFEGSLVTARLGEGRHDLFTRMRLAGAEPSFARAYDGGVADPRTGRIGFVMTDPAAAARLALQHRVPFATCA